MFLNKPNEIIFELTNRCNLRCKMCDIWKERPKKDFDFEVFRRILREKIISNINSISFTGGEPFMMGNLKDYYFVLKKYSPKSYFNINTNGYLTEEIISFYFRIFPRTFSLRA